MIDVPVPGILMMFMTSQLLVGIVIGLALGAFVGAAAMALVVAGSAEPSNLARNPRLPTG